MEKVNKVKLTNLENQKKKRYTSLTMEVTRDIKFMEARRDAQFEMHF